MFSYGSFAVDIFLIKENAMPFKSRLINIVKEQEVQHGKDLIPTLWAMLYSKI